MFAPRAVRKPAVAKPKAQPQPQAKRPLDPAATTSASGEEPKRKRKSRWGSPNSTAGLAEPRKGDPLFAGLAPSVTFVPKAATTSTAVPQTTLQQVPEVASASPPHVSNEPSGSSGNGHGDAETAPAADSTTGVHAVLPSLNSSAAALAPGTDPLAVCPCLARTGSDRQQPPLAPEASQSEPVSDADGGREEPSPSPGRGEDVRGSPSPSPEATTEQQAKQVIGETESDSPPAAPVRKDPYDMFGDEDPAPVVPNAGGTAAATNDLLAEDAVDKEGYYHVTQGELLSGRYKVVADIGRGVFSCVLACVDLKSEEKAVAIKVIKNNHVMNKAAEKEVSILAQISADDPAGKKHCIHMLDSFEHKGHTCMVFDRYEMDLRQVLKTFGRKVGINLNPVRVYGAQLLTALAQLRKLRIVHADIKPDNVLVTKDKRKVVLADFGSASDLDDCEITPYLVSRYYRAPEVSLGHPYGCEIDVWAVGCTLFEMYTGSFLFDGETNNHMLRAIQELRGGFSHKMIRRSTLRVKAGFDDDFTFYAQPGRHNKKDKKVRPMKFTSPTRDLFALLCPPETVAQLSAQEVAKIQLFKDLLEKMLTLDPEKRPTPEELLTHQFFQSAKPSTGDKARK